MSKDLTAECKLEITHGSVPAIGDEYDLLKC